MPSKRMSAAVLTVLAMLTLLLVSPAQAERPADGVPGPMTGTKITESYARLVARDAFFWAWPMVNVYNRRLAFKDLPEPGLMGGADFSLYVRAYWPGVAVTSGKWTPPAVIQAQ